MRRRRNCPIVNFNIPAKYRVNFKESKKRHKYLDQAREVIDPQKKKVTVIPVVISALGTATKELVKVVEDLEIR